MKFGMIKWGSSGTACFSVRYILNTQEILAIINISIIPFTNLCQIFFWLILFLLILISVLFVKTLLRSSKYKMSRIQEQFD